MEESEARVELSPVYDTPEDTLIADRMLPNRELYRRWEAEHARLMRTVAAQARLPRQMQVLRTAAFSLVHRKAMFDYLRDQHVTGLRRRRLFSLFYGVRDYTNAVLAEHGNYVRCSSSYLCTRHLAEHLMHDAAFDEPLQLYERWYNEYFRAFCDVALANTEEERLAVEPMDALKPLLKYQLAEARKAIMDMPQEPTNEWRETRIRKATGDTQKVRTLDPQKLPGLFRAASHIN